MGFLNPFREVDIERSRQSFVVGDFQTFGEPPCAGVLIEEANIAKLRTSAILPPIDRKRAHDFTIPPKLIRSTLAAEAKAVIVQPAGSRRGA